MRTTIWVVDDVDRVGGVRPRVFGSPKVEPSPRGLAFDGQADGLIVPWNPLEGLDAFTVEAVFRPDPGGAAEQRFFHIQADSGPDRILLETRLTPDGRWYADTYIRSGQTDQPLNDPALLHDLGRWHTLALTFDGRDMAQWVDGRFELSARIAFWPLGRGAASIGMRINRIYFFKGAIRLLRFSGSALDEAALLRP